MDTDQAEAFARDGYLVLSGAVSPPLLAALNAVVDHHVLAWRRGEMGYSLSAASLLVHRDFLMFFYIGIFGCFGYLAHFP
jgi:hypothetical protein